METLIAQSAIAFAAGMILNLMPCVLPVMPFKVQALLRETAGTVRSRTMAAAALLAGSLVFFIVLGALTAGFGLMWGQQFSAPLVPAAVVPFSVCRGVRHLHRLVLAPAPVRLPAPMSRHMGAFLTGALAGVLSTPCSGPFLGSVLAFTATRSPLDAMVTFGAIGTGLAFPMW
jgi:thiol:disulfide interchange protein